MDFRILGPLEASENGRVLPLGAPKERVLLASLLLRANRVVATDRLIEVLWGAFPPDTARATLQTYVLRLRRALQPSRGAPSPPLIATRPPGYVLQVRPEEVDLHRFERLVGEARGAMAGGGTDPAAKLLRQALGLWRGPALGDVASMSPLLMGEAARLEEARHAALEERIEAELALGWHVRLVGELEALVAEQPLRERAHGQLMLALYRSGRQAEALAVYQAARKVFHDELGLEPGRELQRLQQQILAAEASLELAGPAAAAPPPATARVVPAQLPADVADFTGRAEDLRQLDCLLATRAEQPTTAVVISAISGAAGVGKTALAVHAAHRLAERFPDGQLYVNLQGATSGLRPLHPLGVLGRFLRALGVEDSAIPTEVDEAAASFRSQVAPRRLMVVLDNAHDAAQVTPLLPASSLCAVLVTSRRTLASLEGAHHLHLDVLPEQEAVELLGRLAGLQRIAREPQATTQLARWCGGLPLALRIAGARLAARPGWPIVALAQRLADAQRRLDELELAELGIRASFQVSYQDLASSADPLDRAAAGAFSLLGVLDSPDVGVTVAARLLGQPQQVAERVLERLVDAHLLETPSPGRYRLHDLLRLYTRELARELHPEHERAAALHRAFDFYVATAWRTLSLLRPGDYRLARADDRWSKGGLEFADDTAALGWLEAERANLLAAVQQAATTLGVPGAIAVQLAQALYGFYLVHSYWQDWEQVNQTAVLAARQVGDRAGEAQAHNDLGVAYWRLGRYDQALACHQQSLAIRRELGDCHGQAASLGNLGLVHEQQGRYDQALACLQESLAIDRELGNRCGQASSLNDLGIVHQRQEGFDQALVCLEESLTIDRELGDRYAQATSLNDLGTVHQRQGRYDQALACQQESLTIRRELGDPHGQAETLRELGVTLRTLGRPGEARTYWQQALAIFERLQSADADQVRALLAEQPTPAARSTAG
jgi:DNA-binding SARP family transcriptional activator/Flp pilus assembly protein TadD